MEDIEILEGNKLTALFDGYVFYPNKILNDIKGVYEKQDMLPMLEHEFKYHKDWNWLMPVVEKINNDISNYHKSIYILEQKDCFWDLKIISTKETVFKAVVDFIKWYNENKD